MREFNLAFGGFYESNHSDHIESMLESFYDYDENKIELAYPRINYSLIHTEYSKKYLSLLEDFIKDEYDFNIKLNYVQLNSPREYNFRTDEIEVSISDADEAHILSIVDDDEVKQFINESSASRDGFSSFYEGFDEVAADPEIFMVYLFRFITSKFEDEFEDYYDRACMYELIYSIDFEL